MQGVFLLPGFILLGHECKNLKSACDEIHSDWAFIHNSWKREGLLPRNIRHQVTGSS